MMYHTTMTRTQIYLPQSQLQRLKRKAAKHSTSVSELIRQTLRAQEEVERRQSNATEKRTKSAGESLLELADKLSKMGIKGPKDLSENMDKYLYGNILLRIC